MVFVWFLLGVPKLCSSFKLQGIGVAGDQQDFLKTDFVVKHRGLFVSLSLGNLTSEMCVSRWPCPMCCKGRYETSFQKENLDIFLLSSRGNLLLVHNPGWGY